MPATQSKRQLIFFAKLWSPVLILMALIFFASSIPGKNIAFLFPYQDVIFHLAVYLILAYFLAQAIKNTYTKISLAKLILFSVIFCCFYGITDEFHQSFVPNRKVSGFDVFIDTLGSLIGSMIYRWRT